MKESELRKIKPRENGRRKVHELDRASSIKYGWALKSGKVYFGPKMDCTTIEFI